MTNPATNTRRCAHGYRLHDCCEMEAVAVTDSRVTPQAAAAAASTDAYHELRTWSSRGSARAGCTCGVWFTWSTREAEHAAHLTAARLTAAVPLLCQPLQDEIDRLRAQIEAARAAFAERFGPVETFAEPYIPPVDDTTAALIRIADALAAVPVGTGNPTQGGADD